MDWQVREVGPAVLDRVLELITGSLEAAWGREGVESALRTEGSRSVVAVEAGVDKGAPGRWVGVVLARRVADLLEIDQVGVLPSDRRRGAAQAMLKALLDEARTEGAREARLELAAGNVAALALYQTLGFVVVGRRARYYPGGEDALLLSRAFEPASARRGGEA